MEQELDALGMLDLLDRPGFCVKNQKIVKANQSAQGYLLLPDMDIMPMLHTGKDEYATFTDGCLCLTLRLNGMDWGACVTRVGEYDVFTLDQIEDTAELAAMAVAARELREPLTNVMSTADRLFPMEVLAQDPVTRDQVARLNRGLFHILRVIGNMSDAYRYSSESPFHPETTEICAFLKERFDKSSQLLTHSGITLTFQCPEHGIYCLIDREKLERAAHNILSNAAAYTPKGGTISVTLTQRGTMLYLSVLNNGDGIPDFILKNIFHRYQRRPCYEKGSFGIGLGMVLVRSTAAMHGGTVLIDKPGDRGTRCTMTIPIRQDTSGTVRSPKLQIDYAGGRDHGLIEFSGCLPASLYEAEKIN